MFKKSEIKKLKKSLPDKGCQEISIRTDLSLTTVYKFFKGGAVRFSTAEKIWKNGWDIINEHAKKQEALREYSPV